MANPYIPSRGLAIGAGIAGGVQNFVQAFQGAQQQQFQNARASEEIAMRREMYAAQMAKLQKETEPVQVDFMKVGLAAKALEMNPEDPSYRSNLSKMISNTMGNIDTPEKAQYAEQLLGQMSGGQPSAFNKAETGLLEKQLGYRSSENIKNAMMENQFNITRVKDVTDRYQTDIASRDKQAEIARQTSRDQLEAANKASDNRLNELKLAQEKELKEITARHQADLARISENKNINENNTDMKKLSQNAEQEAERLRFEKWKVEENAKLEREKIKAQREKAAGSKSGTAKNPEQASAFKAIEQAMNEYNKFERAPVSIMELPEDRQKQLASMRASLDSKLEAYEGRFGSRYPLDDRKKAAPAAKSKASGEVYGPPAPSAMVKVRNIETGQTGTIPRANLSSKYKVIE